MSGGEVTNLQQLLGRASAQRDLPLQKELVKKVCSLMTMGIDVSPLFSSMIMASNTTDIAQKKLVYLFLSYYARRNADLALLTVNTMHRDCQHTNPMIRGLALRSLSSLGVPSLIEYVVPMILKGLKDDAPYVRKIAATATAKLYHMSKKTVTDSSIIDSLYDMIRDSDTNVIANAICALDEILTDEGGIATNKALIIYLLKKIHEFNEWHQILVLRIVHGQFTPENEEEVFQLMNMLDPFLSHCNYAVIMATIAVFMKFTESTPSLYQHVFQRIHDPLITCLYKPVEITYEVMKYIDLILDRSPDLFCDDFKQFYGTHNDPEYLLQLKFSLLARVARSWSAPFIIDELCYSTTEFSPLVARIALQSISSITIQFSGVVEQTFAHLLELFTLDIPWLSSSCLCVIVDLLRKYPMEGVDVVTECKKTIENINKMEDEEGKNAAIWILGEFGEQIATAPYILEILVDQFDELKSSTKLLLLMSCVKLFGKRPPECQPILGDLLALCVEQQGDPQLRFRALCYYKMLRYELEKCLEVVNAMKDPIDEFKDISRDPILSDQLFEEFHTFAVVYGKPCSSIPFIKLKHEEEEEEDEEDEDEEEEESEEIVVDTEQYTNKPATGVQYLPKEKARIDPQVFEKYWTSWEMSHSSNRVVQIKNESNFLAILEQKLEEHYTFTLASGETDGNAKIYAYSKVTSSQGDHYILYELIVEILTQRAVITIKTDLAEALPLVLSTLESFLTR